MAQNLRRALSMSNGDTHILFESNLSIGLWIAATFVAIVPPLLRRMRKKIVTAPAN